MLNCTQNQFDLIDTFIILPHTAAEYIFYSTTWVTNLRIDNMVGHKISIHIFINRYHRKYLSFHNAIKLETYKPHKYMEIKQLILK